MENGRTLNEIMNDVSAGLDVAPVFVTHKSRGVLSEFEAFRANDDLLAKLHKEYVDAREHRLNAQKEFGAADAMTDMALLVEDSAWCVMQTRFMELRADPWAMKRALKKMEEAEADERQRLRALKEKVSLEQWKLLQIALRIKEQEKQREASFWFVVLMHAALNNGVFRMPTMYQFNALAA